MLSQEEIYRHLQNKEYSCILELMHRQKELLKDDPSNLHAIDIFLQVYFKELGEKPLSEDARLDLWKLFTLHTHKFYELPEEYAIRLIGIHWNGEADETLYKAAKAYPDNPVCAEIIRTYENGIIKKNADVELSIDPVLKSRIQRTAAMHEIKLVTDGPFQPYMKVYVRGDNHLVRIAELLNCLPSVKKANVSKQSSKQDLTVYPRPPYSLQEMNKQVELSVEAYFSGQQSDLIFKEETISSISDKAYVQIIDYLILAGSSLEKTGKDTAAWSENQFRNYLVAFLNAISKTHFVSAETHNMGGKSDILVQNTEKVNVLVGECKLWKGSLYLSEAIDQLINRYVSWRDEKTAIIIFNTQATGFTSIIAKAVSTVKSHPLCYLHKVARRETSHSFIFRNPQDSSKLIDLELVLFNFR